MDFDALEREGLVAKLRVDRRKVRDSFGLAERDLKTAKKIMEEDLDWAYSIAYNAMLQAARSLMFSHGYRPVGKTQHISAVRFAEVALESGHGNLITSFDRMRRKRHVAVYDSAGGVSRTEAENAVERAGEFLKEVREELRSRDFL